MGRLWEFLKQPELLREVRGFIGQAFGFALALRGARHVRRRYKARKEGGDDSRPPRGLAGPNSSASVTSSTHCLHCGRTFRDIETLGCGGANRKGQCPR